MLSIRSSVPGHLGCFYFLATMNNVAMNKLCTKVFVSVLVSN